MSTCRCCGQHIEAASQTAPPAAVVRVDDSVLTLCNTAFDLARTRSHAHVEIAHAVVALAMSDSGAHALLRVGLDPQQAGQAADAWLGKWAQTRDTGEALATSAELKQVLREAETIAQRAGRTHATLDDVLMALSEQAGALWSASFWTADAEGRAHGRVGAITPPLHESVALRTPTPPNEPAEPFSREAERIQSGRAAASAVAGQQSLLDREYAWLRDMQRTQVSRSAGGVARAANSAANASVKSVSSSGSRERSATVDAAGPFAASATRARTEKAGGAETAPGGARVMRLFAAGPPATAAGDRVQQAPAPVREDQVTRSILERLDTQERTLAQRFDTQQRMIAELAEAFARTIRELVQTRDEGTPRAGTSSPTTRQSGTGPGGAHDDGARGGGDGSGGSAQRRSSRGGSTRSRSRRGSWQRQSWNSWRGRQRHAGSDSAVTDDARHEWSGRMREPREERAPRAAYEAHEMPASVPRTSAQHVAPHTARHAIAEHETREPDEREKRFYLTLDDHIEKAPSIGPRTAALLNAVGVMTVRDLLTCDPESIASRLHNRYITAERLAQWQAQSRLVCTVPWLRGTHAQLLAGAGFDTLDKIVAADAPSVCAAILKFAATRDGMSVLRSSPPPGEDWVIKRLEHARAAEPERAVA